MIKISYTPLQSTVTSDDRHERVAVFRLLSEKLSVWVEGAQFTQQYEFGIWDGYARFFSKTTGQFPSGLLVKVASTLLSNDYDFSLEGLPNPFPGYDEDTILVVDGKELRDYQMEALRKTLKWYRGIWKVATNGGKTMMCGGLAQLIGLDKRILVIVPRQVILQQFVEVFSRAFGDMSVGRAGSGALNLKGTGITVAMYQTLSRNLNKKPVKTWLQGVDALIVDECHFATAATFKKIITKCPAEFRIGMSGTPFKEERHKSMEIRSLFGPVLTRVSNKTLIAKGVSVKPHIIFLDVANKRLKSKDYDYRAAYAEGVMHNKNRNRIVAQLARGFVESGRQTIVMVQFTEHLKTLKKLMPWAEVTWSTATNRSQIIERLDSGEVMCVICTPILDTGFSTDHIEALINAGGGKSHIGVLQRVGRALRKSLAKEKDVWIVDFHDQHHRDLKRHANKRFTVLANEDAFDITELIHELPVEVQNGLSPQLLNSSHFDVPLLES